MSDLQHTFDRLASAWKKRTGHQSNTMAACRDPAGQAIVALGSAAVPLIFARLQRRACPFWMTMLRVLLGDGPEIPEADRGRVDQMATHWLAWGRERGFANPPPALGV